ncbi:DAK2 domain-containing protein [Antribacter sp. KLBMP9083]|uniref:DAK2 domain-containing protein n=1 Tax=Antribacter soli TaxID=2910976 RepID=A0AA41U734_9MICO|nr:DAK2 domain-containing protein [Antribacter soli]MCF4121663.1 DAK2 domain-containing protein [Antribacter soli]
MTDVRGAGVSERSESAAGEALDAARVRAWARLAARSVGRERAALDRVNVFPVADADTGTNLHLTLREGERAVAAASAGATGTQLLGTLARGALLGARGNSGVILSEWLRGLAVAARRGGTAADLLAQAARSARAAVARPAEGTILTAADAAAGAARAAQDAGQEVLSAAARAARAAAVASRGELAALSRAGVLDAGACGLVLVLDALVAVSAPAVRSGATTAALVTLDLVLDPDRDAAVPVAGGPAVEAGTGHHGGAGSLELMFVLSRPAGSVDGVADAVAQALRDRLAVVGDSVVVVGGDAGTGDAVWQGHVHTDDLAAALAAATGFLTEGASLAQVHVRHLEAALQHEWGVVVATDAPALAVELALAGAVVLLTGGIGGQVEPLTAQDVHRAAASTGARRALVLPGTARGAVGEAAAAEGLDLDELLVLEAATDVHVVAALAALGTLLPQVADDPDGVPAAVRATLADLVVAQAPAAAACEALERLIEGAEPLVVTALLDDDVPPAIADDLAAALARLAPEAELVALPTGRPGAMVHLGVEDGVEQPEAGA